MNPLTLHTRPLLAGEIAANLAEVARWDWSDEAQNAAACARRLADRIYDGAAADDLIGIVHELSDAVDFPISRTVDLALSDPAEWLAALSSGQDQATPADGIYEWKRDACRAFYALRADLYPEGRGHPR